MQVAYSRENFERRGASVSQENKKDILSES